MSDTVRLDAFWNAVKARLQTEDMRRVLYGKPDVPVPVYRNTDDYSEPEGGERDPWGRLVIVPVTTLWDPLYVPGQTWKIPFLLRAEFNNYREAGYEITYDLEATHDVAHPLMEDWIPTGLSGVQVVFPIYRRTIPQPMPLHDELRGLWFTSSEYRTEVAAPAAA